VPKDLRSDYYVNTRRARIVEIRTWGKLPFEFAHFTDAELADAILKAAQTPHPRGRAYLCGQASRRGLITRLLTYSLQSAAMPPGGCSFRPVPCCRSEAT
jgi:hypothetical protein